MRASRSRRPSGIERADRLVEDQQPRPRRRAPGRSRAAGASRPSSRRPAVAPRRPDRPAPSVSVARSRASAAARPWSRPASSTSSRPGHPAVVARILVEDADPAARAGAVRGRPAGRRSTTDPAVGRASPVISRSVVVLPAPFGPSRPKTDPAGTSRSSPSTASTPPGPPNRLVRPRQTTAGGAAGSLLATPDGQVQDRAEQADEADEDPPHQLAVAADGRSGRSRSRRATTISTDLDDDDRGQEQEDRVAWLMTVCSSSSHRGVVRRADRAAARLGRLRPPTTGTRPLEAPE